MPTSSKHHGVSIKQQLGFTGHQVSVEGTVMCRLRSSGERDRCAAEQAYESIKVENKILILLCTTANISSSR